MNKNSKKSIGSEVTALNYHELTGNTIRDSILDQSSPLFKDSQNSEPTTPRNARNGKLYNGMNAVVLMEESAKRGFDDPRWSTLSQAESMGASLKDNQTPSHIQYWANMTSVPILDNEGKEMLDENQNSLKETVRLDKPQLTIAKVYNAEQFDHMPSNTPIVGRADKMVAESARNHIRDLPKDDLASVIASQLTARKLGIDYQPDPAHFEKFGKELSAKPISVFKTVKAASELHKSVVDKAVDFRENKIKDFIDSNPGLSQDKNAASAFSRNVRIPEPLSDIGNRPDIER